MIKDFIIKEYEIYSSKSVNQIITEIEYSTQRQSRKKIQSFIDPVKYKDFKIFENTVVIERNPFTYNPLQGIGTITFKFEPRLNGTNIICTISPTILNSVLSFGLALAFLIYVTIQTLIPFNELNFNNMIFLGLTWIICLLFTYFGFRFNRFNLECYSKTILYDLKLAQPDKD